MLYSRDRYEGIQTLLKTCGDEGCLFLSILSIAEDVEESHIDLVDAIHLCLRKKWIAPDFECLDSPAILNHFTSGKIWSRREVPELLAPVRDNEYTVANYYNPNTEITHRRRRPYDTLKASVTVRDGYIKSYYIYSWKAA